VNFGVRGIPDSPLRPKKAGKEDSDHSTKTMELATASECAGTYQRVQKVAGGRVVDSLEGGDLFCRGSLGYPRDSESCAASV